MNQKKNQNFIDELISAGYCKSHKLLEILQSVQAHYGYLPQNVLRDISIKTDITPADIAGVSTFYDFFRHKPAGKHRISVCVGTACHVKGSARVYDAFKRTLKIDEDHDTDADRLFTVEKVACLGCCTLAPAVQIDSLTYGHVTPSTVDKVLDTFLNSKKTKQKKAEQKAVPEHYPIPEVRIGLGSCCIARGSGKIKNALTQALAQTGINARIKRVGCVGMCYQTPLLEIVETTGKNHLYTKVEPQQVKPILIKHLSTQNPLKKFINYSSLVLDRVLTDSVTEDIHQYPVNVREGQLKDFLGTQKHIATENCGVLDPLDIEEYKQGSGFKALKKCITSMSSQQIIEQVKQSGLRGRGGAGYPAHLKWSAVASQNETEKYIVCNGDEGDPGAFMDRMLMESYPFRILEGMIIAAYAVKAKTGCIYIRSEYPLAVERLTKAIQKCKEQNLLGKKILGTDFDLEISIVPGAGAFVCGEETALLASIQGKRGMPRFRPPYPAQKGLWQKPTLINNVETYSAVPWIMQNMGTEYAKMGTEKSKGTKVFALAGKVARGGLIEVPMGVTVRQIVQNIGGGIGSDLKFKAVQIGGPSGGCLPEKLSDISVDYESLTNAGAIMGSGGLVVLDESDCMVDIAKYFLEFTQDQSCGRCTFCRVGTLRMLEILENICSGNGKKGDIEKLEDLAHKIKETSLCGLGKTAPNPVLSTIKFFRNEYQAHIDGKCPAGKCPDLIHYTVTEDCIGCTICAQKCPVDAIKIKPYQKHEIDDEKCIRCDTCKAVCPENAVKVE